MATIPAFPAGDREPCPPARSEARHPGTGVRGRLRAGNLCRSLIRLCTAVLLTAGFAQAEASLGKDALELVNDAVYEVVVKKPDEARSPVVYEKPLPWDLVPYHIRQDEYLPVGTAFATGPNTFVSAAHVMDLASDSQFGEMFLRSRDGEILSIDSITRYSLRKDFVVFTLRDARAKRHLEVNREPVLNEKVYAVGNALGQGIVVRDGLYTSRTPEEQDGEWEWLRFSAAASPGNSGGPLLDRRGRVIGVVLRKSANENLNYALPISVMMEAPENLATMDLRISYRFENMDMSVRDRLDLEVELPLSYLELRERLSSGYAAYVEGMAERLLREHRDEIFPHGRGSESLLRTSFSAVFPRVIGKADDGSWNAYYPSERETADLGDNGYLEYGAIDHSVAMHLRKPDDVPLEALTEDSKLFMDLVLEGISITRDIGSESVRVVSLGKADEDYVHTDGYGRPWQVRVWSTAYDDHKLVVFSLPVPGGNVSLLKYAETGRKVEMITDLKVLTNFLYLSYYSTLEDWREFLALDSLLPEAFAGVAIDYEYDDRFRYRSRRLAFDYGAGLMDITPDSDMRLNFSYFNEGGEVVWDVASVMVGEDKNTGVFFDVTRNLRPTPGMSDDEKKTWRRITRRDFPYDGETFFQDGSTYIAVVHDRAGGPDDGASDADRLYTVVHGVDGNREKQAMQDQLSSFTKGLEIREDRKAVVGAR